MTRTRDPFPVDKTADTRRLRVRYVPPVLDPVEIELAKIEARREEARHAVASGRALHADPVDRRALRGIPVAGNGGTVFGSDPEGTAIYRIMGASDDE